MASRFWVGGAGTWDASSTAHWSASSGGGSGASVPGVSDQVIFDANSGTGAVVGSAGSTQCDTLTTTGSSAALTFSGNGPAVANNITLGQNLGLGLSATGFNTGTLTITSNGFSIGSLVIGNVNGLTNCNYVLADDMTISPGNLGLSQGLNTGTTGFNANNHNVSAAAITRSGTPILNVTMGSGTWTLSGQSGTLWDLNGTTNLSVTPGTSTIKLTNPSSNAVTFAGGGSAYWNIWNATTSTSILTISGSNTFNDIKINPGRTQKFTAGTTQTVSSLTTTGTLSNPVQMTSTSGGTQWTLTSSNACSADFIYLTDANATGSGSFTAGVNSRSISHNTGWIWTPLPISVSDNVTVSENNSFVINSFFLNAGNAYVLDNVYATAAATNGNLNVTLSKDAGVNYQNILTQTYTGVQATQIYGAGATELWGSTWLGSDITNTNFRLKMYLDNGTSKIYKTFGFTVSALHILTGIKVEINAKFTGGVMSVDLVQVTAYSGTSVLPVLAGAIAYASNGRKNGEGAGLGTGVQVFYDGSDWMAVDSGAIVVA